MVNTKISISRGPLNEMQFFFISFRYFMNQKSKKNLRYKIICTRSDGIIRNYIDLST